MIVASSSLLLEPILPGPLAGGLGGRGGWGGWAGARLRASRGLDSDHSEAVVTQGSLPLGLCSCRVHRGQIKGVSLASGTSKFLHQDSTGPQVTEVFVSPAPAVLGFFTSGSFSPCLHSQEVRRTKSGQMRPSEGRRQRRPVVPPRGGSVPGRLLARAHASVQVNLIYRTQDSLPG